MFCENCGQQIEDGSVFCGNCGATIKNENIPAAAVYDTNGYSGPSVSPKKINLVAVLTAALFIPIAVIIYCLSTGALSVYKTDPIKNNAGANEETVSTAESRSEAESIKRAWPDMFENAYCEFTATKGMNVYCDAECTTRGTAVPPLEYNAYIGKGDVCRIFSIGYSGVYVEYPTTSNGYRKGYVHYYDLFSVDAPIEAFISKDSALVYADTRGTVRGKLLEGDSVYVCLVDDNYATVIYSSESGNRAYVMGLIETEDYKIISGMK